MWAQQMREGEVDLIFLGPPELSSREGMRDAFSLPGDISADHCPKEHSKEINSGLIY